MIGGDYMKFEYNNEIVNVNMFYYELDWENHSCGQYSQLRELWCDMLKIIFNHDLNDDEIVQYSDKSWFYVYNYNNKLYRVWWYNDGLMYVQYIDNGDSVDDIIDDYTYDVRDIITAILNDK